MAKMLSIEEYLNGVKAFHEAHPGVWSHGMEQAAYESLCSMTALALRGDKPDIDSICETMTYFAYAFCDPKFLWNKERDQIFLDAHKNFKQKFASERDSFSLLGRAFLAFDDVIEDFSDLYSHKSYVNLIYDAIVLLQEISLLREGIGK